MTFPSAPGATTRAAGLGPWVLAGAAAWATRPVGRPPGAGAGQGLPPGPRWLVISPHLDDAALSLGATLARHTAAGGQVTVVTALAGRPCADGPAGWWDAAAGFGSEREATVARRLEDLAACARLGATAVHLDGGDRQYEGADGRDATVLTDAVVGLAGGHDAVLLPGFPLAHDDHRWVTEELGPALSSLALPIHLYAEEPYTADRHPPAAGEWATRAAASTSWTVVRPGRREQLAKLRTVASYRTQLPLLEPPGPRWLPGGTRARTLGRVWAAARRGEWVSSPVAGVAS